MNSFEESFKNEEKTSLALGATYKGFRDKLYLYNFNKVLDTPYYNNPRFTKVNPKLKLIAVSRNYRGVHREVNEAPAHLEPNNEQPSIKQQIRELKHDRQLIDGHLNELQKELHSVNARILELVANLPELQDNLTRSEMMEVLLHCCTHGSIL
ncbi:hypothetical protein MKW92_005119 [Papaver armeniacum]|nr:hypothetical protein MKW92_005119 [Papaver armeniacum]